MLAKGTMAIFFVGRVRRLENSLRDRLLLVLGFSLSSPLRNVTTPGKNVDCATENITSPTIQEAIVAF